MTAPRTKSAPIPIPAGGFKTDEQEAEWLTATLLKRMNETLVALSMSANFSAPDLNKLILLCLHSAGRRAIRQSATRLAIADAAILQIEADETFNNLSPIWEAYQAWRVAGGKS